MATYLLSLSGTRCSLRCSPTPSIPAWANLGDRIGWEKRPCRWATSAEVAAAVVRSIAGNTFDCRTGLMGLLSELPSASVRTPTGSTVGPLSPRINERGSAYLLDVSRYGTTANEETSMLRQTILRTIDRRAGLIWNRFDSRERTPRMGNRAFLRSAAPCLGGFPRRKNGDCS